MMQVCVNKKPYMGKGNIDLIDAAELIPVDCGGKLVVPANLPINELGRRLLQASLEGDVKEIKWLMSKGAPFTADWLGTSPLHFAATNNHVEVCELLLRAGISKNARTKVDRTPMHMAAFQGHLEIIKLLVRYEADIERRDLLEMTPLHWAVQNEHLEVVSFLVSEGAQIDVVNKFGLTPMEISVQCQRLDILDILKSAVCDPLIAAQNLSLQLYEMDNSNDSCVQNELLETEPNSPSMLEPLPLDESENEKQIEYSPILEEEEEEEEDVDDVNECVNGEEILDVTSAMVQASEDNSNKFTESIRLLQEFGITMLPTDNTNILSSVYETGRSMFLTDIGKEVLNSVKPADTITISQPTKVQTVPVHKKIILTKEQVMAIKNQHKIKQINGNLLVTQPQKKLKRIIMKKNKIVPFGNKVTKIFTTKQDMYVKALEKELQETKNLLEEYKQKFFQQQAQSQQYEQQIIMLTQNRS